ncbi:MAG: MBL fold metallo-hydrolase [Anaerolineae bacterium]|nr:MBL fold metallo-hydrolase [Anaerolineae bacterium]
MELSWFGLSCFRLSERGMATVVTDPYGDTLGLPPLKLKAEIVTISHNAPGHNYAQAVKGQKHTLTGPGEYEIGNVFIIGIATEPQNEGRGNILYLFDYDGLTVAHLGDMHKVPTQAQIEALEQVHVLLVPVGGGQSLNAAQASEIVSMLEPNIVIPMHYQQEGLDLPLDHVERFLKEMGVTDVATETSLKISSSSLPEETQIVLLTPRLSS